MKRTCRGINFKGGGTKRNETSHENYVSHRRMIIGEFHLTIKKQIINRWKYSSKWRSLGM